MTAMLTIRASTTFLVASAAHVVAAMLVTGPALAGTSAVQWASNGATVCEKYLTPDVTGTIFKKKGSPKTLSPQSCAYGSDVDGITITLKLITAESFAAFEKYLVDPKPLAGVGDSAFQSMIGITAIKGDRGCDIDVDGAGSLKLHDAALASKLGEICNKLFALP